MGHGEQSSDDQRIPGTPGNLGGVLLVGALEGSNSYVNPDADPTNGISGRVVVRWSLKRS